jgi:hypothetical protein
MGGHTFGIADCDGKQLLLQVRKLQDAHSVRENVRFAEVRYEAEAGKLRKTTPPATSRKPRCWTALPASWASGES